MKEALLPYLFLSRDLPIPYTTTEQSELIHVLEMWKVEGDRPAIPAVATLQIQPVERFPIPREV